MNQSNDILKMPRVLSFKLLYIFWLTFSLIFSIILGDCIYSQLVLPRKFVSIESIEELAHEKLKGHIIVSAYFDGSIYNSIKVN